jgi:ADP-ribose pyrophosphatase YjhB (NUDIX family)
VATSNVDLLVQDEKHRVLLAWREDAFGQGWHVPGSIIRHREEIGHRINSCAKDEFGCALAVAARPVALIQIFDDRGHSISMCYTAALQGTPSLPLINEGDVPEPGSLRWFDRPPLALYPSHLVYSFVIEALQQGRLGPGIEVFTQHVGRRDAAQGSSAGAISADEPLTTLTEPTAPKPGKAMNSGKQA